ncbi:MAG: cation transporter [Armatimonadetes bacterium]|nr:cation transporter [Armatimonadota bacterium]
MHDHSHCEHHPAPATYGSAFIVGIVLNSVFVLGELVFGIANHSLSLLADAGHNLGDVLGLAMGWAAVFLATKPVTSKYTYGYRRASILAAVGNSCLLLIGVGAIAWEAIQRFSEPVAVPGTVVMAVAAVGILINGGTALMFMAGRKGDINREAAFAHMLTDAVVAAGVVVAGLAMQLTKWAWLDPAMSLVIVFLVAGSSWRLLRRSFDLAIDAVPDSIDIEAVKQHLEAIPGVTAVVDLHIWPVSSTQTALTAHLVAPNGISADVLESAQHELSHDFAIDHSTIQVHTDAEVGCALTY